MILFDLVRLQRVRPWDVNLSNLLSSLIGEMGKKGYIDFKASGIALLSSSTIYRMKSELVLDLQEPPQVLIEKPIEFLPPPIQLPYRFEYTSTTINNLLNALEETLKTETIIEKRPKLVPIIPAPPMIHELDEFMVEIEDRIAEIYQKIVQLTRDKEMIPLSSLTSGLQKLEIIRIFLLILFIACREKIQLWQEEDFAEIFISLV
jgi:segregation and condensation protein A